MNRSLYGIPGRKIRMKASSLALAALTLVALCAAATAFAQDEPVAEETAAPAAEPVVEIAFGQDVDRAARALVGPAETFAAGIEQLYCLTRLQNLEAPTTVTHAWYREGEVMARVELSVRSSDWRTWSSKRLMADWTGAWEVKVLDETGKVLAARGFVIE